MEPVTDPNVKQLPSKIIVNLNVNANDIDNRLLAGDIQVDHAGTGVQAAARAKILSNPSLKANRDDPVTGSMWFSYINTKVAPLNNMTAGWRSSTRRTRPSCRPPTAARSPAATSPRPRCRRPSGYPNFDLYNATSKPGGDIAAAKQQLQQCGQPNGFNLNIAYRSDRPRRSRPPRRCRPPWPRRASRSR